MQGCLYNLFISLVVVVILYFLAVVMGLLVRTRSDEASLLRSRGANMLQVGGLLTLGEGAIVIFGHGFRPFSGPWDNAIPLAWYH